jgi:hypothetical protein
MAEQKTCLSCKNENCFIVYGVPQDKKKRLQRTSRML